MSADPAGFALVNPNRGGYSIIEATNWYAYVSNNPVNYVDPTGEIAIVVVGGTATVLLITALAAAGISAIILDPENQENLANAAKQIAEDAMRIAEGAKVVIDVLKSESDNVDKPNLAIEDTADAGTSSGSSADLDLADEDEVDVSEPGYRPPDNPKKSPGKGWEWRGKGEQGSAEGSYHNPKTKESLHPDFDHPEGIDPHWDYIGPDRNRERIYLDGRREPK